MKGTQRQQMLLKALAQAGPEGISIREVAGQLGIPPVSVHRLLSAWVDIRWAIQEPKTRRYRLGPGFLEITGTFLARLPQSSLIQPYLQNLVEQTGLTAFACSKEGNTVLCVALCTPHQGLKYYVHIGQSMPLHASAAAKALIYHLDPHELEELLLPSLRHQFTPKTPRTLESILNSLALGRERGYWECREELEWGVDALATPLLAPNGEPLLSFTVVGSTQDITHREPAITAILKQIGRLASEELGALLSSQRLAPIQRKA
jgi:IclR family KDG regulon transcriptional repressor